MINLDKTKEYKIIITCMNKKDIKFYLRGKDINELDFHKEYANSINSYIYTKLQKILFTITSKFDQKFNEYQTVYNNSIKDNKSTLSIKWIDKSNDIDNMFDLTDDIKALHDKLKKNKNEIIFNYVFKIKSIAANIVKYKLLFDWEINITDYILVDKQDDNNIIIKDHTLHRYKITAKCC